MADRTLIDRILNPVIVEGQNKEKMADPLKELVDKSINVGRQESQNVQVLLESIEQTRKSQQANINREGQTIADAQKNIISNERLPESIANLVGLFDPNFDTDTQIAKIRAAQSNITLSNAAADAAVESAKTGILQSRERAEQVASEVRMRSFMAEEERQKRQEERAETRFGFELKDRSLQTTLRNVQLMEDNDIRTLMDDPNTRRKAGIPLRLLEEEKNRRVNEGMALRLAQAQTLLAESNVRQTSMAEAAITTDRLLQNMSINRLAGLANEVKQKGLEQVPHPDMPNYMIPAGQVQQKFAERQQSLTATAKALSEQSGNRVQVEGSLNSTRGKLFNLQGISEASSARVLTLGQSMEALNQAVEGDKLVSESMVTAAENLNKEADALIESVVESQPQEAQPAMRQYVETGTVGRNQAATVLGVASGRPGVFAQDHVYADSMKTFTDEIGSILEEQAGQQFVRPDGGINLAALSKERDIEELIDSAIRRKPEIQARFANEVMWQAVELAINDLRNSEGLSSPWMAFLDSQDRLSYKAMDNQSSMGATTRSMTTFLENLATENNRMVIKGAPSDTNMFKELISHTQTSSFRARFNQMVDGQFRNIYEKSYGVLMAPEGNYSGIAMRSMNAMASRLQSMIGEREAIPDLSSFPVAPSREMVAPRAPTMQDTETKDTLTEALRTLTDQATAQETQ